MLKEILIVTTSYCGSVLTLTTSLKEIVLKTINTLNSQVIQKYYCTTDTCGDFFVYFMLCNNGADHKVTLG